MTRFLPLTRGGWPAEVLCEVTVGAAPLCVKHTLLNGDVSVEMHMLDGGYSRGYESNYDLIPAPEPSEAALRAAMEAWRQERRVLKDAMKAGLSAAYAIDGITPQQQPDRVADLEAEVAKVTAERADASEEVERLTAELDRYRNWVPSDASAKEACCKARTLRQAISIAFHHDFPGTQPGTGEQA